MIKILTGGELYEKKEQ